MSQQHRTTSTTTVGAAPSSAMDDALLGFAIRRETQADEFTEFRAMGREQRQAAYATGQLTGFQVRAWYGDERFRGEQPLTSLNGTPGEFFHILCKTPEYLGE